MVKPLSFKDEVASTWRKMQEKTRKNRMTQKVINEMRIAHQKGWFFVFDTLTLADDRLQAFNENPNALPDFGCCSALKVVGWDSYKCRLCAGVWRSAWPSSLARCAYGADSSFGKS